ncbi:hypothetical protein PAPYR_8969 [Paratrimastix pyriformis]|uniref:Uncharacterized protein n=1 Tax=Paratrimastix pyriformis TaxID=342808 RepID=A0ABQ8UB06_9EUKA|nr:hypothetical protein PAPYR_8969 [Paratrimastix pyriformis]
MTVGALWERLPPELLRAIVEESSSSLQAYLQLLGLSHATRAGIRGTLREISFVEPDPVLVDIFRPTTDAVAALVGPCKNITRLSFPEGTDVRGVLIQSGAAGWVDETFGGHTQLAVLSHFPTCSEPDVEQILSHLSGLVELTVNKWFGMSAGLLAALARSCPGLRVLRCSLRATGLDLAAALAPLSDVLNEVDLQDTPRSSENLEALVRNLSAVTSLRLPRCASAALEPLALHLTSLDLNDVIPNDRDLPGPLLCRLKKLSLRLGDPFSAPLTRLLAANQATLSSLSLMFLRHMGSDEQSLVASLRALPHLASLHLSGYSFSALPPDLVDRLEHLSIRLKATPEPVHITSSRLRQLDLSEGPVSGLVLHCPALVEFRARCHLVVFQCPRLRTLSLPSRFLDGATYTLPDLEAFDWLAEYGGTRWMDPAWLLTGSPRLRSLSGVRLTRPDLLAMLGACRSLVRLKDLYLYVTQLPNPLVLRLPGQLEHLDLNIEGEAFGADGLDLQVEAPGLLGFSLTVAQARVRLGNCPSLVRLGLRSWRSPMLFQVDEALDGTRVMQPRKLHARGLETASLIGLLVRHGSRLRDMVLRGIQVAGVWPQLMGDLSALPWLSNLHIEVAGASPEVSLSCPQLRRLKLGMVPGGVKVVLACPLLEKLSGIERTSPQLAFALPAPNLSELLDDDDDDDFWS